MQIPGVSNQHVKASQVPLERLASNPNVSKDEKVKEACRQFEGVLVKQILTEARKSLLSQDGDKNSVVSGIYNDMVTDQIANGISQSGTFGLAKSLEKQVIHQVLPKAMDPAQPAGTVQPTATGIVKKS